MHFKDHGYLVNRRLIVRELARLFLIGYRTPSPLQGQRDLILLGYAQLPELVINLRRRTNTARLRPVLHQMAMPPFYSIPT